MTAYNAHYSDGQTASSASVQAVIDASGIRISDGGTGQLAWWRWQDVRLTEPAAKGRPIRLANRSEEGARLTIEDAGALEVLKTYAPYLSRDPVDGKRIRKLGGVIAICAAIVLFFVYGLPWIARPAAMLIPVAWEEQVGESTIQIVNQLFADNKKFCESEAGVAALDKLSQQLSATFETPYKIKVDVLDSPVVNALAAPGGRIVLFRGLIKDAKSPAEVAGVLAHEMAHVIERHPTQGMINSVGWSALLTVFTGGASLSNEVMARFAAHLATSAYTRDLESEADDRAVAMLTESGIGTDGMADFFRSIEKKEIKGLSLPAYLSTHPKTTDRIDAIDAQKSTAKNPVLSESEWQAFRAICD